MRTIAVDYASTHPIAGRSAGTVVVTGPDKVSLRVITIATGAVASTVRGAPAGWDGDPIRWWSSSAVLASCLHDLTKSLGPADLVAFASTGATVLTKAGRDHNTDVRGWRTSSLPLVTYVPPAGDPLTYARLSADGALATEKLGLAASAQPTVLTVVGSQAYLRHSWDSTHRTSAWARYDLGTKKLTSLGQVDSALSSAPE
ncbi:MAG TPA: hypothetical protein PKH97_12390 [Tetrasphaera sp.]|uniref:hypothetical protein n=1 Tax=Nostocoides sp. TaxID=1917966 RepID=UPI002C952EAC|nr:hypothetical protein [Tetrasphaera sp.]HNQ07968.1 hypothetical protein [Tetrasphaera sp.]